MYNVNIAIKNVEQRRGTNVLCVVCVCVCVCLCVCVCVCVCVFTCERVRAACVYR